MLPGQRLERASGDRPIYEDSVVYVHKGSLVYVQEKLVVT